MIAVKTLRQKKTATSSFCRRLIRRFQRRQIEILMTVLILMECCLKIEEWHT